VLTYWLQNEPDWNFGDAICELLLDLFEPDFRSHILNSRNENFYLIGSVLDDWWISDSRSRKATPVFWCCGTRGEPLRGDIDQMRICGVRGRVTEQMMGGRFPALGDPGLLCPIMCAVDGEKSDEILLIPHSLDTVLPELMASSADYRARGISVVSPLVRGRDGLEASIRRIAGCRFVWAGAMHAAIVALAYDVPFAFFRSASSRHLDVPAKWADFSSMHGFEPAFFSELQDARAWYRSISEKIIQPPLLPILQAAPGPIRQDVLDRARELDWVRQHRVLA
jgi:hypothetical protein